MPYEAYWNEIVSEYNDNLNCKEEIVQKTWEVLFKLCFGYSKPDIDSQRSVKMGVMTKRADIVVKNGGEDLFIVELKRHALHEGQEQLFSYLNQLKVDLGVLVCDNLYVYDYDFTAKTDAYSVLEIPFAKDDSNGARFVELFSKENFDKQKIKDFINEGNAKKQAESDMKNELSSDLAARLLKDYFAKKYPTVEKAQIEKILAGYNVSVSKKALYTPAAAAFISSSISTDASTRPFAPSTPFALGAKDSTQYTMNGASTGGKGPTVYAAVKYYFEAHPNISFGELQAAFPDNLAKPGFGKMIRRWEDVTSEQWSHSRFNKHPLILSDGTRAVVTNQWKPDNIQTFIDGVKRLGIEIVPIGKNIG